MVTLPANQEGGVACAQFPILADSLALEGEEEFAVSFVLDGPTDDSGRVILNNGRARAIPGLQLATVRIQDETGKKTIISPQIRPLSRLLLNGIIFYLFPPHAQW